jgi:hypothetical protein
MGFERYGLITEVSRLDCIIIDQAPAARYPLLKGGICDLMERYGLQLP